MKLDEYVQHDAHGLAELVRTGQVSPRELALLALEAINAVNPQLNAVIEVYRDRIDDLDDNSLDQGPLRGVPFLMKDTGAFLAGRKTEWGSRLGQGHTADEDAFFVKLLRASGINILGRTNVPEFCISGTTENVLYGNTSTPWRQGYSAGGSTGGGAAAVAAGIVPMAHGSDIGGSIRIPAAWCGGVGLKPSRGRVSVGPALDEAGFGMAQHFVQTRTVRDAALMLDILGQPQPGDPYVIAQQEPSFKRQTAAEPGSQRIAFSARPLTSDPVNPEVADAVGKVAATLESMGHHVEEAAPPYDANGVLDAFQSLWFFGYHRVFDSLAAKLGREVGPDTLEPVTLAIYEASQCMDPYDFLDGLAYLNTVRRDFGVFFQNYDVWLTPTAAQPPEPHGLYHQNQPGLSAEEFIWLSERPVQFTIPYNVTGLPAISLPLAETKDHLPIGIQLGTRHAEEGRLLDLAFALEQALPWHHRVPPIHVSRR
jgi:amidase